MTLELSRMPPTASSDTKTNDANTPFIDASSTEQQPQTRTILLNRPQETEFCNNSVSTCKYTILTFIPKNLWEQFHRFANLYYLVVSILSAFYILWPAGPVTNILPLLFVLSVTALKEIIEDVSRHRTDEQQNKSLTSVIIDGQKSYVMWRDLTVGQIVMVPRDHAFPCDMVVLSSSEEHGVCYIETANLDGETNMKLRKAVPSTVQYNNEAALARFHGSAEVEMPTQRLYHFDGALMIGESRVALGVEQLLLRGSYLRNTAWVYGVCVYTGHDTKVMKNASDAKHKSSNVERLMNNQILFIFGILFGMCLVIAIGNALFQLGNRHSNLNLWYLAFDSATNDIGVDAVLSFLSSMIGFSYIIPISLYVSLEVVKLAQAFFIGWDIELYHEETDCPAVVKTSSLNEELGQVSHIFSDKTGTLTCNQMDFIGASIGGVKYYAPANSDPNHLASPYAKPGFCFTDKRLYQHLEDEAETAPLIHDFLLLLALCHTVMPELDEETKAMRYNASSPDEGALVEAARQLGYAFEHRHANMVEVNIRGKTSKFEILNVLEFTSDRKRMSVIVRTPEGTLRLFCKGADNVIFPLLTKTSESESLKTATERHLQEFAVLGLRTLCVAVADISDETYNKWLPVWREATTALSRRQEKTADACANIEKNLRLLGATSIEDKLQDGVVETIKALGQAGIKVWMLTGDKQETAHNVGIACSLVRADSTICNIGSGDYKQDMKNAFATIRNSTPHKRHNCVIIDGVALAIALKESNRASFLDLTQQCDAVICCRSSPLQKRDVVKLVKDLVPSCISLSIGDGANDVSMIREAHIGVGISGLEGRQAVLASDYAIAQFRFLRRLLLVHGRYAYRRIGRLVLYSLHKNLVFILPQFIFAFYSGFSGQTLYDEMSSSFFNVFFSFLPIVFLSFFERDVPDRLCFLFPPLYLPGPAKQTFNLKRYACWTISALWQGLAIFFGYMAIIQVTSSSYYGQQLGLDSLGAMAYTVVVLVVNLKIAQIISSWYLGMALLLLFTLASWFLWMGVMDVWVSFESNLLFVLSEFGYVPAFWFSLLLFSVGLLCPDHVFKYVKRTYFPELFHVLQERKDLSDEEIASLLSEAEPPRIFEFNARTHRGYSFSETPDGNKVLAQVLTTN